MRAALAFVLVAGFAARAASAQESQQDIADRIVREQMELRARQVQKVAGAPERAMGGSTRDGYIIEAPGGSGPTAPKPPAPPKPKPDGFPMWILVAGGILLIPVVVSMMPRKKPPTLTR